MTEPEKPRPGRLDLRCLDLTQNWNRPFLSCWEVAWQLVAAEGLRGTQPGEGAADEGQGDTAG